MKLQRRPDWPQRLTAFLEARRRTPFAWAGNDCVTFARDWVAEMTAEQLGTVTWATVGEAAEALKAAGGMREAWTGVLGRPSQNWRDARRGDVGLVELDGRLCGVVCTGQTWAGPGFEGLMHLPLDQAVLVWQVG